MEKLPGQFKNGMATTVYGYKSKNSFDYPEIPVKVKPFVKWPHSRQYHYGYVYPNVNINPTFVVNTLPRVS